MASVDETTTQFYETVADGPTYLFPSTNVTGSGNILDDSSDASYWSLGWVRDTNQGPVQGFAQIDSLPAGITTPITWTLRCRTSTSGDAFFPNSGGLAICLVTKEGPGPNNDDYGAEMFYEIDLPVPLTSDWTTYTGTFGMDGPYDSFSSWNPTYPDGDWSPATEADLVPYLTSNTLWLELSPFAGTAGQGRLLVDVSEFTLVASDVPPASGEGDLAVRRHFFPT